jgi:HEAT repeat protein
MSDMNYQSDIEALPTFDDALAELKSGAGHTPSPDVLYGLSGLSLAQIKALEPVWQELDMTYRRVLMQMLVDVSVSNYEMNYRPIGYANLDAEEPQERQAAIELLWEDKSLKLMDTLIHMAQHDDSVIVRAEAIRALGRFVLLGELGDLPDEETKRAEETLLQILDADTIDTEIHRRALEAIANCTRTEIAGIIARAYNSSDDVLRTSAIAAMGNTCDSRRWGQTVLKELDTSDDTIRITAAQAAGELQLEDAMKPLTRILAEGERDEQEIAIWSLGEIGGKEAVSILQHAAEIAEENEDDDMLDRIDDALGNASLAMGELIFDEFTTMDDMET